MGLAVVVRRTVMMVLVQVAEMFGVGKWLGAANLSLVVI